MKIQDDLLEELTKEIDQIKSDIKILSSADRGSRANSSNGDDLKRQIVSIQRQLTEFRKMSGAALNVYDDDETLDPQEKVQKWLAEQVRLPQYFELFVKEGFDELEVIKHITKQDLIAMGIDKLGHQRKIIQNAEKL